MKIQEKREDCICFFLTLELHFLLSFLLGFSWSVLQRFIGSVFVTVDSALAQGNGPDELQSFRVTELRFKEN